MFKLLLLSIALTTACETDQDEQAWKRESTFVWRGEKVTIYGYDLDESDPCGGSFAAVDTHAGAVRTLRIPSAADAATRAVGAEGVAQHVRVDRPGLRGLPRSRAC